MRTRSIVAVVLAIGLTLIGGSDASARSKVALGLSVDPAVSRDMGVVDDAVARTRATPAIWSLWSSWGSRGGATDCTPGKGDCAFPAEAAAGLKARGIVPMIWWKPTDPADWVEGRYERYRHIINGRHDAYIRQWARDARAHGGPVILRFAHEANGHWYPWGLARFDNTPKRFRKAWRHVWRIFQQVGATNVRFLWNPIEEGCAGCIPDFGYDSFYPGNRHVDYVGVNTYNWGWGRWQSLASIAERPIRRLRQVTRSPSLPGGKPVILGEVSSNHTPGNKATWIRKGYASVYARWPKVKAIVYLDVDMRPARQPDWRLVMPPDGSALRAYRHIAADPRFSGRIP